MTTIGHQKATLNDIVNYYIEQGSKIEKVVTLMFLKDFNLSECMAKFYEKSSISTKASSEKTIDDFVEYLVSNKLAKKIVPKCIKLGETNRPSKVMQDEYKFKRNPSGFMLRTLQEELDNGDICLEKGIKIVPKDSSSVKVKATIDCHNVVDVIEFNVPNRFANEDLYDIKDGFEEFLNDYFIDFKDRPIIRTFDSV